MLGLDVPVLVTWDLYTHASSWGHVLSSLTFLLRCWKNSYTYCCSEKARRSFTVVILHSYLYRYSILRNLTPEKTLLLFQYSCIVWRYSSWVHVFQWGQNYLWTSVVIVWGKSFWYGVKEKKIQPINQNKQKNKNPISILTYRYIKRGILWQLVLSAANNVFPRTTVNVYRLHYDDTQENGCFVS